MIYFEYVRRTERPLYSLFGRSCNRTRLGQVCNGTCFGGFFENSAEFTNEVVSLREKHAKLENRLEEETRKRKSAERKVQRLDERLKYANANRFGDKRQK